MKRTAFLLACVLPTLAHADQVYLRGGGVVRGIVVERTERTIVVDISAGRVTLPLSRVERVVLSQSPLAAYRERAARLAPGDAEGWLELALWARDAGLLTQAREAFERVLLLDPANDVSHGALGDVRLGDRWVTPEESYRARGYVVFEGIWMTPEERDGILRERASRAEAALADRARAEAEARVREAEARARAAEAEARRAEAQTYASTGVPYPVVLSGPACGPVFNPYQPHRTRRLLPPAAFRPPQAPIVRPVSRDVPRSRRVGAEGR